MARIRTIKPEFPQSETVGRLSRDARLLFIMLWTIVDDEGRTRAASRMLASLLYPYDDDARDLMPDWLEELEREGCVELYTVDGSSYLEITNWRKHQKIDKPTASKLPSLSEGSPTPREVSRKVDTDLGPRTSTKDREVDHEPRALEREFDDEFWPAYPHKVGKPEALTAFIAARQGRRPRGKPPREPTPLERIMAGLRAYVLEKPPDRQWMNPATFLNGNRFDDQPASTPVGTGKQHNSETVLRSIARVVEKRAGGGEREAGPDGQWPVALAAPLSSGVADDVEDAAHVASQ